MDQQIASIYKRDFRGRNCILSIIRTVKRNGHHGGTRLFIRCSLLCMSCIFEEMSRERAEHQNSRRLVTF